jgi:hypothetical protein
MSLLITFGFESTTELRSPCIVVGIGARHVKHPGKTVSR